MNRSYYHDAQKIDELNDYWFIELLDDVQLDHGKNNTHVKLKNNSIANDIQADNVESYDKYFINNLKSIDCSMADESIANNIETKALIMCGNSHINNLIADKAFVTGSATIDDATIKNSLDLVCNAKIKNLKVLGENPQITLTGNAEIIETIKFENAFGTVILEKGPNGEKPKINSEQIINGKIQRNYPITGFDKVVGMEELKEELRMDVIEPIRNPEEYAEYRLTPVNGIMLYGPPGCGKTFISEALAEELGMNYEYFDTSRLGTKYPGEGTKYIKEVFKSAIKKAPSVIFIDEADTILVPRDELGSTDMALDVKNQISILLKFLNNINDKKVFVIFATNMPQSIDSALKRTGRIDKKIFVGPPDSRARHNLLEKLLSERYIDSKIDYHFLANKMQNYTVSDIVAIVEQSAREAARERVRISEKHIMKALDKIEPSISSRVLEQYLNNNDNVLGKNLF